MFNISDKVVRIKTKIPISKGNTYEKYSHGSPIQYDKVYVISKIISYPLWPSGIIGLAFVGGLSCYGKYLGKEIEVGFDSRMFRKLDEVKADNKINKELETLIEDLKEEYK